MITAKITLCAVPAESWAAELSSPTTIDIASFARDALAVEKRLARGVNLDNERARYSLLCTQMELAVRQTPLQDASDASSFASALERHKTPRQDVDVSYLSAISRVFKDLPSQASSMRLGASYYPPDLVSTHLDAFESAVVDLGLENSVALAQRIRFFRLAAEFGSGVVELLDPYHFEVVESIQDQYSWDITIQDSVQQLQITDLFEAVDEVEGENAYEILRAQLEDAIKLSRSGISRSINFSNQPHNVITEVLNEFAYSLSGKAELPVYVPVIYSDGSQARPFPLLCLASHDDNALDQLSQVPILTVALLSMRHLALDHEVDMAWLRNREVSKSRTFSETDEFCYVQSQKQLAESRVGDGMRLHIYQTGFQPAVVGLYRAVVEELLFRTGQPPSLQVTPLFYRGKAGYRSGKAWQ